MQTFANTFGVHALARDQVIKTSKLVERTDVLTDTTAGAVTYTAAQVLGGIILRDPNGAGRTDVLPTAALLVAAMKDEEVGDTVQCLVINNADAAETITISAGSGGTVVQIAGTRIIPQNTSRMLLIRLTNVLSGTEAYDVYM